MNRLGKTRRSLRLLTLFCSAFLCQSADARKPDGLLELAVSDEQTGQPLPARLHLRNARGRPAPPAKAPEPWGVAPLGDHAYVDGSAVLGLRRGAYRFDLDAGPEYRTQHGHFEIVRHAEDSKQVEMRRAAKLTDEGWTAADLASCRPDEDLDLLRRAEQLGYTPKVVAQWINGAWAPPVLAERRQRDKPTHGANALWSDPRGTVWLIDPDGSRAIDSLPTPGDSTVEFLRTARDGGWRVVAAVDSRELPLWVALELVDALVVIDGWADNETRHAGREPDKLFYPGPQGPGRWRRDLYGSLVEAGVRLPPVALSGSGLNTAPIGSSRCYAFTAQVASPDAWWRAADDLAVVVTSGPLLRPFVEGAPPGETFLLGPDGTRTLTVSLNLATRTKIEYLELIKNGQVARSVRISEIAAAGGRLPSVSFDEPGWLAVAAVTEDPDRYELAMSAPWFVEGAAGGRISAKAAGDWLAAFEAAASDFGDSDPSAYEQARGFWRTRTEN